MRGAYFGKESGQIHLSQAQCEVNDTAKDWWTVPEAKIESMNVYIAKMQESSAVVRTMLISLSYIASTYMYTIGTNVCRGGVIRLLQYGGESEREG